MRAKRRWAAGALLVIGAALLTGCGDDGRGGSPAGTAMPTGGACPQAGFTETGCVCMTGGFGNRTCTDKLEWTLCSCPPRKLACAEGDPVTCTCPGSTTPRETTCLLGGTFDCPCDGGAGMEPVATPDASSGGDDAG